jgi:hypothetical protein
VGDLHGGVGVMKVAEGDRREADKAAIAGAGGVVTRTGVDARLDEAADGGKRTVANVDAAALARRPRRSQLASRVMKPTPEKPYSSIKVSARARAIAVSSVHSPG